MYLKEPERLQFEISNVCNLNCISCARTDTNFDGSMPSIDKPQYISKETFKKIITAPEFKTVKFIEFCGSIDDPAAHPEFLELVQIIIDYAKELNKKFNVQIHTNGSLRTTSFWQQLGLMLNNNRNIIDYVVMFNIDGLEDTNHIYRRGSNWTKIMENTRAFINTGAMAIWQYLVFSWNEHQIEEAKALSKKKFFHMFFVRENRSQDRIDQWEKVNATGLKFKVDHIQKSNPSTLLRHLSKESYQQIECPTQKDNMYFIDYKSRLWPCCFIPGAFITNHNYVDYLADRLFNRYDDSTWNDCSKHSIADIVNHRFYQEDLTDSWNSDNHGVGNKDRIYICSQTCNNSRLLSNPLGNKTIKKVNT